jgi:hypothetical protein
LIRSRGRNTEGLRWSLRGQVVVVRNSSFCCLFRSLCL